MPHSRIVWVINRIKASPIVEIVHIDPSLDAEAWDLFQRRPDKTWSLVDCASFVVMQKRGINEALTSDVHFETGWLCEVTEVKASQRAGSEPSCRRR
jgi:uncharacterized protein